MMYQSGRRQEAGGYFGGSCQAEEDGDLAKQ